MHAKTPHQGRSARAKVLGLLTAISIASLAAARLADGGRTSFPPVPQPSENPITESKRVLGKMLFWEEQLSSDSTTACASCHRPAVGGIDPRQALNPGPDGRQGTPDDRQASPGVVHADGDDQFEPIAPFGLRPQVTDRTAPSAIMAMFAPELFRDGRASSQFLDPETGEIAIASGGALESQLVAPAMNTTEMVHEDYNWPELRSRLTAARPLAVAANLPADLAAALVGSPTYPDLFEAAFGDREITARRIAFAIATYERTLVPDQAPFDRFMDGDQAALTPRQQNGMTVFLGSNCAVCHTAPLFTNDEFRNIGVRPPSEDTGRQQVTGDTADRGKMRVVSLRNTGLHPRFMHNGLLQNLGQVFDFYAHRNGRIPFGDNLDPLIQNPIAFPPPQQADVIDFLANGLRDPRVANETFPFDAPMLHAAQQPRNPLDLGGGNAGSGGIVPAMIANRPPYLGNRWFRVGLDRALGNTQAWLAVSHSPPQNGRINADELIGPLAVEGQGVGAGFATGEYPIPANPALDGSVVYLQWIVDDPGAQGGQARSAVVQVTRFCGNGQCFCVADFNRDGASNTLDVLGFLNAWNAGSLEADTNRDGEVNTIDVLGFLNHWSSGC
ncbi:MAG: hypothetical protein IPJ41_16430 [Phycisphaerales bacterium]|nr:hypothetical protein [Phycisphaerales bacterium]